MQYLLVGSITKNKTKYNGRLNDSNNTSNNSKGLKFVHEYRLTCWMDVVSRSELFVHFRCTPSHLIHPSVQPPSNLRYYALYIDSFCTLGSSGLIKCTELTRALNLIKITIINIYTHTYVYSNVSKRSRVRHNDRRYACFTIIAIPFNNNDVFKEWKTYHSEKKFAQWNVLGFFARI